MLDHVNLVISMSNNNAIKAGIWYIVGNFLIKGIGFISTPLFTRIMTQSDIGDFSNYITWLGILLIVFSCEMYSSISVARFDFKDEINEYVASNLLLGSAITLIIFLLLLPFKKYVIAFLAIPEYAFYYSFVYIMIVPAIQMYQAKCQIEYKYKTSVAISLITSIGCSLLSLLLVVFLNDQIFARVVGYLVPYIFVGMCVYLHILYKSKFFDWKYCKYGLHISLPIVCHLLAGYVLSSSDRIMIKSILDSKSLGLYSIAYSSSIIISVFMSSLNSAWAPWSMEMINKENICKLRKASKFFVIFFVVITCFIVSVGPEILQILGGKNYMEAEMVIPPVMIGIVFQFMYTLYVNIEQYQKKMMMVALGTVLSASLNVILNAWLIPIYGYVAAAYTTLLSYMFLFSIHFVFVFCLRKLYFYDTKFNFFVMLGVIVYIPIANFMYKEDIYRVLFLVGVIFIFVFVCFKFRATIKQIIELKSISPLFNLFI